MHGYILVIAEGGLITSATYYAERKPSVRLAETAWSKLNAETDDVKIFDLEVNVVWQPPREEELLEELQ